MAIDKSASAMLTEGGKVYYAHRLAWFITHGVWPVEQIDHINGDRDDNRIANLREATGSQNLANTGRPKHNTSGLKGASWSNLYGRWIGSISLNDRRKHLGYFDTAEEAHAAYVKAAREKSGEFAKAG